MKKRKIKISCLINLGLLLSSGAAFLFARETLPYQLLLSGGLLGLSGSLTNSLAIHMLFERIPLVYGSGIIALNFREIKQDLEELMIRQFFNGEQIQRFLAKESGGETQGSLELARLAQSDELIDFDHLFTRFKSSLSQSFANNPLAQMALPLLESKRSQIIEAIRSAMAEELARPELEDKLRGLLELFSSEQFEQHVRQLIRGRLDEMTPQMVKELVRHMMESKLVWLVIWGAILGALLGLLSALLRYFLMV